jgi:hypothetical protein
MQRENAWQSFERRLLFAGQSTNTAEPDTIDAMNWRQFWERHCVWLIGIVVALAGACLISLGIVSYFPISRELSELIKAVVEALIVAGALSVLVDPFLKNRLLREATRGIFKHMVGFDPEPEIKDRLERIVFQDAKLLCRRRTLTCRFEPLPNEKVRVTVDTSVEVETPGLSAVGFSHFLAFERAEQATVHTMSLIAPTDASQNYNFESPVLITKPPGILEARPKEVKIRPGNTYNFYSRYSMILPEDFYHAFHVVHPTIGVHVSVIETPEGFIIAPDQTANHQGNEWDYPSLFMPGQNLTIRWYRYEFP